MANTYINVLQAAIEGQGVALAGYPLVNRFLADGTLKTVEGVEPMAREDYYLIDNPMDSQVAAKFGKWLIENMIGEGPN